MPKNLDAIYKNGTFFPVNGTDLSLSEGTHVRLTVEPIPEESAGSVLDLAANVYVGLSDADISEIETIATNRTAFFR
jgi:predicted DNA-binding antitoxin AbrB/MazE fold protein